MDGTTWTSRTNKRMRFAATLVVLWAISGCASYIGSTASSFLIKVRDSRDPNVRHLAYQNLANANCYDNDEQKAEAARVLSARLYDRKRPEPVATRAVICRTLGELGRPEGREVLLRAVDDPEPLVRSAACRALGKVGTPDDATTMARVMAADNDPDCRIAAIEGIGTLRASDPRINAVLVDGMQSPDPAIRLASYNALRSISNQELGPDPKQWKAWLNPQTGTSTESPKAQLAGGGSGTAGAPVVPR